MVMWYDLRVGSWKAKITPIKTEVVNDYPNVDKDGNEVKWVKGNTTRGYFVDKDGNKVEDTFKLVNGKVRAKLEKTKETQKFKEVDITEVKDVIPKLYYYVECEELQKHLTENKAVKFAYSSGNGYKAYYGYFFKLGKAVVMVAGETYLSEQMRGIEDTQVAQKLLDELKGVKVKSQADEVLEI